MSFKARTLTKKSKMKLAVVTSHVIQYQAPLLRKIAASADIDLKVYFNWGFGVEEMRDPGFNVTVKWDIPLLEGYDHKFLKNSSLRPSSKFWGQINFGIVPELAKRRYDAVLLFGWSLFTNWLVFLTAFIIGTRVILLAESPLSHELTKKKTRRFLRKLIFGVLFRLVDKFLYIGEENRKFYEYYGVPKEKLFFAPYAVENDRLFAAAEELWDRKPDLKQELGLRPYQPVILFVGKFMEKKRPLDLLRAYEIAAKAAITRNGSPALVFVGDGILRPKLENYSRMHGLCDVRLVGFKNQTDLPRFYALADIFVLPSGIGETWGLVTNEAMCFGLPVIVSDMVGCSADLIRPNENGFVFPVGDIGKLAEHLSFLVSDVKRRAEFGRRSREIIAAYSHEADVDAIVEAMRIESND